MSRAPEKVLFNPTQILCGQTPNCSGLGFGLSAAKIGEAANAVNVRLHDGGVDVAISWPVEQNIADEIGVTSVFGAAVDKGFRLETAGEPTMTSTGPKVRGHRVQLFDLDGRHHLKVNDEATLNFTIDAAVVEASDAAVVFEPVAASLGNPWPFLTT